MNFKLWLENTENRTYYHGHEGGPFDPRKSASDGIGIMGSVNPKDAANYGPVVTKFTIQGNVLELNHPQRKEIEKEFIIPNLINQFVDAGIQPPANLHAAAKNILHWEDSSVIRELKKLGFIAVEGTGGGNIQVIVFDPKNVVEDI